MNRRLKRLLTRSGLSQTELSRRTGYTQQYISLILLEKRAPTAETCVELARALDCRPWDIDPDLLAVVPDGLQSLAHAWMDLSPGARAQLSKTIQQTIRHAKAR